MVREAVSDCDDASLRLAGGNHDGKNSAVETHGDTSPTPMTSRSASAARWRRTPRKGSRPTWSRRRAASAAGSASRTPTRDHGRSVRSASASCAPRPRCWASGTWTFSTTSTESSTRPTLAEITAKLVGIVRRVRPDVVITFGPEGAYGHPDHIAISQFTTAALVCATDSSYMDEVGGDPTAPRREALLQDLDSGRGGGFRGRLWRHRDAGGWRGASCDCLAGMVDHNADRYR